MAILFPVEVVTRMKASTVGTSDVSITVTGGVAPIALE